MGCFCFQESSQFDVSVQYVFLFVLQCDVYVGHWMIRLMVVMQMIVVVEMKVVLKKEVGLAIRLKRVIMTVMKRNVMMKVVTNRCSFNVFSLKSAYIVSVCTINTGVSSSYFL